MRYFTPSSDPEPTVAPRAPLLTHVVDVLRLPWGSSDAIVVTDRMGALHLIADGVPGCLPATLRSALTLHELAIKGPARPLKARTLYLFALDGVEQPLNTPGTDDPVELTGTLHGPFGDPGAGSVVKGTLTVTRGELLSGIRDGVQNALIVPGVDGRAARCLHILLPGDTEEATRAGGSLVLCYPLPIAELDPPDVANEALMKAVLADVLTALQADLRGAGDSSEFTRRSLPVASRDDFEDVLKRDGWEIRGETAVRLDPSLKKGLGGLLTSVLGVPEAMTRALPREGSFDDFLALAREAIACLPASSRTRALASACLPVREPATTPAPSGEGGPPDPALAPVGHWTQDFAIQPSRTTAVRPASRPGSSPAPTSDPAAQKAAQRGTSKVARPSWMDDFE